MEDKSIKNEQNKGYLMVLAAGSLWGTIGLFATLLSDFGVGAGSVAFFRLLSATIMLAIILLAKAKGTGLFRVSKRGLISCMLTGFISQAFYNICYMNAIEQCGMFNTDLGRSKNNLLGGEEKDIFNRLKAAGLVIYYFPDVAVNHIIPPHRTTVDFIKRLGAGVGTSERLRCRNNKKAFTKRLIMECFKWGATLLLWVYYLLTIRPVCGNMLVKFRYNVSLGLLGKK